MDISRIRAALSPWRTRVETTTNRREPYTVNKRHQKKKVSEQTESGEYTIHPAILSLADDLGLDYSEKTYQR